MEDGAETAGNAPLRILAHLDASERSSRGMVGGILRYAALHHDVEVRLYGPGTAYRELGEFRDWRPDGIVVGAPLGRTLAVASLRLLQTNFKAVTGRTVLEAIQEARLRRACQLLAETNVPIGEIAGLCGFKGTSHLKSLFRRRFGRTMRDWRGA